MKNLANCKPSEFLRQTSRIRKSVENWLSVTEIMEIRKRLPKLTHVTDDMSAEKRAEIIAENRLKQSEQVRQNAMDILDAVLDKHPDETLELLALLCFIEPDDVDNHPISEYLESFTELVSNETVINFFISLARLGQMNTSNP